jgi:chromosome segregation ATPase
MDELKKLVLTGFRAGLVDPKAIAETARQYHAEYAEQGKKNSSEKQDVEKRRNRLTVQIDRLVRAVAESDQPLEELLPLLKSKEAERVGLEERLRLLNATNVIELHPHVIAEYKKNVERLHEELSINTVDPETRTAFRNLLDSVVVHPTGKRQPYEISIYGRLAAIMGVDLFPTQRSAAQILDSEGVSCTENGKTEKSVSS